jgi:hypothetical protein
MFLLGGGIIQCQFRWTPTTRRRLISASLSHSFSDTRRRPPYRSTKARGRTFRPRRCPALREGQLQPRSLSFPSSLFLPLFCSRRGERASAVPVPTGPPPREHCGDEGGVGGRSVFSPAPLVQWPPLKPSSSSSSSSSTFLSSTLVAPLSGPLPRPLVGLLSFSPFPRGGRARERESERRSPTKRRA